MEDSNRGRGSASSYRQETIGSSVSSSRSVTIVSGSSTVYASGSSTAYASSSSRSGTIVSASSTDYALSRLSGSSTAYTSSRSRLGTRVASSTVYELSRLSGGYSTAYTSSSSRSDTIVSASSAAYASSGSRFSTASMKEVIMHIQSLGIHEGVKRNNKDDWVQAEEQGTEEEHIRSLVQEFFSAPTPWASCVIRRGDMGVVERWLKELGVGWVLRIQPDVAVGEVELELDRHARTWIQALHQIAETIRSTRPLFPDSGTMGLPSFCVEGGGHVVGRCILDRYHLALFIQATVLTMLTFVDVLVASSTQEFLTMDRVIPFNKLIILLGVYKDLSSYEILELFNRASSVEVKRIENEMAILLSEYQRKLGKAIWSTMEKIRTKLLEDGGSSTSLNPQGSSDIHNVTRSVMTYVELLRNNYSWLDAAIQGHVPYTVASMIVEMMSSLQEKLVNISESFSDEGLKFLFLLNNSCNMQQSINSQILPEPIQLLAINLTQKIEGYMERYLQVSWAPLLSCLFSPTPLRLRKHYSLLSKFESKFQKTYTTQIECKIPNPMLRRRLRKVITDKIIPGYTAYIEDNKVTNPKFTPQELKAMLQELFEG